MKEQRKKEAEMYELKAEIAKLQPQIKFKEQKDNSSQYDSSEDFCPRDS